MGLEVGTYISDLITTNPPSGDPTAQGDDHLRLLKTVLKNTFPNATKPIYLPNTVVVGVGTTAVLAADQNKTFLMDTTGGQVNLYMPALLSADAGWECSVMKTNAGVTSSFIFPPSGTIQSGEIAGLGYARRCIPGARSRILWTGSNWFIERVPRVPVGSVIEFQGVSLPFGYEWPNGQTLAGGAYLEYLAVRGSYVTQDRRGRYGAMADQGAGRLGPSGVAGEINSGAYGGVGGEYYHVLTPTEMPYHAHAAYIWDPAHTHTFTVPLATQAKSFGSGQPAYILDPGTDTTAAAVTGVRVWDGGTLDQVAPAGGNGAHNMLPPTLVTHFILVVE